MATVDISRGPPGLVARPLVVKQSKPALPDTLVMRQTTKKSSHVICSSVAIRCPGPTGPDVRPLVSLVVNNAVTDGPAATRMMSLNHAHVKPVMVSTLIGPRGRHVRKHVPVATNNGFALIRVVSSMNVAFVVSWLNHRLVASRDNGHCGRTTRHVRQLVPVAQ